MFEQGGPVKSFYFPGAGAGHRVTTTSKHNTTSSAFPTRVLSISE